MSSPAHYEVRAAARTTPSITATVAPNLTLEEARTVARETVARHGDARIVSIYDTVTRQAVA